MCMCLVAQFCPTLCDSMECSLPRSSVHSLEYWSGFQDPPPGERPNPGTKPRSPALQVDSLLSEPPGKSSVGGNNTL